VSGLLTFYNSSGAAVGTVHGTVSNTLTDDWTSLAVGAVAPSGSVSVAFGITETAAAPIYLDDATLGGAPQYIYAP
jgi:hypothetical protein